MTSPLPNIANAAALRTGQPEPAPMHENPVLAKIMAQLLEAAERDEQYARHVPKKRDKGFFAGRADAKRHVISVLAQVKLNPPPSAGVDAVAVVRRIRETALDHNLDEHHVLSETEAADMLAALTPAPTPVEAGGERKGYISADNGQGMGLPQRCTRYRCGGEIKYEPVVSYSSNGDNICTKCGASYGSDA